jgi:hypothetical protein
MRVPFACLRAGAVHSRRQGAISKINRRAAHDTSAIIDDQAQAPAFVKEGEAVTARIVIDAMLANACNRICAHEAQNLLRLQSESCTDDRRVYLDGAVVNRDCGLAGNWAWSWAWSRVEEVSVHWHGLAALPDGSRVRSQGAYRR